MSICLVYPWGPPCHPEVSPVLHFPDSQRLRWWGQRECNVLADPASPWFQSFEPHPKGFHQQDYDQLNILNRVKTVKSFQGDRHNNCNLWSKYLKLTISQMCFINVSLFLHSTSTTLNMWAHPSPWGVCIILSTPVFIHSHSELSAHPQCQRLPGLCFQHCWWHGQGHAQRH